MPSPKACVAVVEDDPVMGGSLVQRLALEGYETLWWRRGDEAMAALRRRRPDVLVCDIRLPDMSGEDLFREVLPDLGAAPVLFVTAFAELEQAVRLIRKGADEYITKPFDIEDFLGRIDRLIARHAPATNSPPTLGVSAAMREIEELLRRVADVDSSVLLIGESGVGKEVAARFLHQISPHAEAPFMAVNCAAIPSELMESELFGHERGAFTGAHARHEGYAERAGNGILFLDEVGDLPLALQGKLLRLLQERVFTRLGGEDVLAFNARLVCSTNKDLDALVRSGRFRSDLYYRINVIPVVLPPLRDRPDDILPLIRGYIARFAADFNRPVRGLTTIAEEAALAYDWPGNVRELRNRVERAVALAMNPRLGAQDLFPDAGHGAEVNEMPTLNEVRDLAERRHIKQALERTGGQIAMAAELLGVSRTTLWEKMRKLGLSAKDAD